MSLILLDTTPLVEAGADPAPLREALRAARGPWRIVAGHHPIASARPRGARSAARQARYAEAVGETVRGAGVPVQLFAAGHEHSLQLLAPGDLPGVQLIAGSGSDVQPAETRLGPERFALARLGFARVDLADVGNEERLVVSLFALPRVPLGPGETARLVARWSIGRDGSVRHVAPRAEGALAGARP